MQSVIFKLLALAAICLATPHGEKAEIENLGSKLMTRDDGVEMMGTFLKYRSVETGPMANLKKVSSQQSAMKSLK
ncbi:hypothetical protein CKM354_001006000 [Cercospora kikuchii]|uniref:Uncharacterized protein n=1 Tax=Cercospora kikuchii TaxID=84275 RepID=A0A9P3CQB6_9PEZI|nr:uncharacterized protein CKM354_001006000 [Cercospora kikuchii]GIZ46958.1 hypothetical protein CKM354_001006000 [Cercospora kikuchii]